MSKKIVVLIGSGAIGQTIVRRIAAGKHVILADISPKNAQQAVNSLTEVGFSAEPYILNIADSKAVFALAKYASSLGNVVQVINSAGVSPSQASIEQILQVDLYGTAVFLTAFGEVIAESGAGLVISSQSGHRLPALSAEENQQLAMTPREELLALPMLMQIKDTLHAYQLSKRGNALRVQAEAVRWGKRHARVNCISPGIIYTPLANDELNGERKDFYRDMLKNQPAGRGGTPDEVAELAQLLLSENAGYITGSDFLIDGGATAKFFYD